MLFEVEGYNVVGVPSAEEALNKIQEITPQMFITDIKLTGMDGFSFYNEVRKNPSLENIPFIFISAYNDDKAIQNVKNLGAVGYLTKPYNLEDLLKTVKQHI
ncbi:MAG: response regulator [Bacteroidota bacterium]|nr:response regulator [Bacteroidota bacterium]